MGNRIIKDTIRTSKTVNSMTDFQFRVWVYLITYVDDYGRGSADPELIKGLVFPRRKRLTESDIEKSLSELAGMGCISLYDVDGESYFYFPNWGKHQRIQTKKSKFPAPEDGIPRYSTVGHGESPPESNPIQYKSNPNPNPKTNRAREARPSGPDIPTDPKISTVFAAYADRIESSSPVTERIRDQLLVFLEAMGPDCCIRAMDEAVESGKISWKYVKAILEKKREQGVRLSLIHI